MPQHDEELAKSVAQAKAAVAETIDQLSRMAASPVLFPHGITKVEIEIKLPGSTGFVLKLEGPEKAGAPLQVQSLYSDHSLQEKVFVSDPSGLGLKGPAKEGAEILWKQFGNLVVFTSGFRTLRKQCDVMAANIVSTGDRRWIEKVYAATAERDEVQKWVDDHPNATSKPDLSDGLFSVMSPWSEAKQSNISRHLAGAAFDVQPIAGPDGAPVKDAMQKLPKLHKFLPHEAGVEVWHAQFELA
jgi:hypothetical protein